MKKGTRSVLKKVPVRMVYCMVAGPFLACFSDNRKKKTHTHTYTHTKQTKHHNMIDLDDWVGIESKKKKSAHVGLEATVRCRWMPRVAVRRVGNVFINLS